MSRLGDFSPSTKANKVWTFTVYCNNIDWLPKRAKAYALEALGAYMGPHFMLLLSIYVLYSNVTYIDPVSCLVEIKLFQNAKNIPPF